MDWTQVLRHYDEITGIHPAADLFPMVEGDELQELCADIKERGLQQPIVVWHDGSLLDGRNRLMACYRTNQEVVLERYEGDDPVQFSLSANLHRRHLNAGQRAIVALKVRELLQPAAKERQREAVIESNKARAVAPVSADLRFMEQPAPLPPTPAEQRKSTAQAAKAVGASPRAVEQAARVAKVAPDLLPQVQAGTLALDRAHREAQQRQRQQAASLPALDKPAAPTREMLTLLTDKGDKVRYPKPKNPPKFNSQDGTEIGWAMFSWNPVTGCRHTCSYCYARALATKDGMQGIYPVGFTPLFHHERLACPVNTPVPKRAESEPAFGRVFVCSMADLFGAWVPQDWIDRVVASTVSNPQWEYLFLTKYPQRYDRLQLPASGWIGASVDEQNRAEPTLAAMRKVSGVKVKWLSLEPLLEPITFSSLAGIDWIVIGAQSENPGQNPPFAPKFEWVADLVATARRDGCKVWLKTNLLGTTSGQWPGMSLPNEIPE
jgi:protein gp37/ParB-like chromosome segregation protein Spo0J